MSKITITSCSSTILTENSTEKKKRRQIDESICIVKKKLKHSFDITTYWKKIQHCYEIDPKKTFPCKSKNEYFILHDPLDSNRLRFIISKSSFYWLKESIRVMQTHVEYISTIEAALMGEILEIERNLKALKIHVEKHTLERTFFNRAEALVHFVRLCRTIREHSLEKHRRRLEALLNLCVNAWLHMFDILLPTSIVRVQKSFLLDDDYEDFENQSILRHYLKDDQKKIQKANDEFPNLRHLLYSIICLAEQFVEKNSLDRIYLERFQSIYEVWIQIDNQLNGRKNPHRSSTLKKTSNENQKISWNFLLECDKYEKNFGLLASQIN